MVADDDDDAAGIATSRDDTFLRSMSVLDDFGRLASIDDDVDDARFRSSFSLSLASRSAYTFDLIDKCNQKCTVSIVSSLQVSIA